MKYVQYNKFRKGMNENEYPPSTRNVYGVSIISSLEIHIIAVKIIILVHTFSRYSNLNLNQLMPLFYAVKKLKLSRNKVAFSPNVSPVSSATLLTFLRKEGFGALHDLSGHDGVEEGLLLRDLRRVLVLGEGHGGDVVVLQLAEEADGGACQRGLRHRDEETDGDYINVIVNTFLAPFLLVICLT